MIGVKNESITKAVDAVLAAVRTRQRGDLVTYAEIKKLTTFDRDNTHWSGFVQRLRNELLKDENGGISIHFEDNVGFFLDTVAYQAGERHRKRQLKSLTQQTKDARETAAIPDHLLTQAQREAKYELLARVTKSRRVMLFNLRKLKAMADGNKDGMLPR